MGSVSETERSEWRGFAVSGQGVRCDAEWGIAAAARSDGAPVDPVAAAIDASGDFQTLGATTLSALELTGVGARGAPGDGVLRVDLGNDDGDARLVLVEEQGAYTWFRPDPRTPRSVEIPIETTAGTRGRFDPVRRILRIVAVKTVGMAVRHASGTLAGAWDERQHPYALRTWTPDDHREPEAPRPDLDAMGGEPALLVIHGFTGSICGSFRFESDVVDGLYRAYEGRTFAFDHPTLAVTPPANAATLGSYLKRGMTLDVLAHSRGGLVARELARRAESLGVDVRSITFVATPNDGTPLGDPEHPMGLIDALTNLVGVIPGGDGLQMVLELLRDVVLKSALEGLVGMAAMKPDGEYLTALNGSSPSSATKLRAIAADFEPLMGAGIVKTAQNRLLDRYFGGVRNDRIVPTLSTIVTSGQFRVEPDQRLVLDSSRSVNHSTFWTNDRVVAQLRDWLRPDWPQRPPRAVEATEHEPLAEVARPVEPGTVASLLRAVAKLPDATRRAVEQTVGGPLDPSATPPTGKRGAVVVLPGIMGTHLRRTSNGQVVWVDPLRLARGRFAELALPAALNAEIEPAGLHRTYLPLLTALAATDRHVHVEPFDWRADIRDSARRLARTLEGILEADDRQSVHLVAHSMGGLVARSLRVVAPDVWAELKSERRGNSGRLVMLGTPNGGSFATPLLLAGQDTILKTLALVDQRVGREELLGTVATFPGIYQMLPDTEPSDDDHAELFEAATWGAASPVSQQHLADAKAFHDEVRAVIEPDRMVVIAGYGHPTPYRLQVDAPGKFLVGRSSAGDGRVALELALLKDVPTFYLPATHGGLPSDRELLDAIGDLLETGSTAKLRTEVPAHRGDPISTPVLIPAEDFDQVVSGSGSRGDPAVIGDWRAAAGRLDRAFQATLGGGAPTASRTTVRVEVRNASLEVASFPVVVGHYARLPQGGAEAYLDAMLEGSLATRARLGLYPETPGSAIYVAAPIGHRPRGGIVLGLGEMGALTPPNLATAMAQGVVAYVRDVCEHASTKGARSDLGVSAVLIGTPGRRGLTVEQCVAALVEGVIRAVGLLNKHDGVADVQTIELQIVEKYDQAAEDAAIAVSNLVQLLPPELLESVVLEADHRVTEGDGRMAGAPSRAQSGTSWISVNARMEEPDPEKSASLRRMTFSTLARGAQSNLIPVDLDLAQIKAYVDAAVTHSAGGAGISRTLYELLFPHRAKLDLDRTEGLRLVVDDELAEIPWELLSAGAFDAEITPLALRAGMLRQLQSGLQTRERYEPPSGRKILVVGDPPTGSVLQRLPGARDEAHLVANLFEGRGWDVNRKIYGVEAKEAEWIDILDALNAHPYRVVHIAAHGIFDDADDEGQRSGVVLGPERHQRITALNFKQMSVTPDLVFLNCCHLGKLGTFLDDAQSEPAKAYRQPHRVAASVARQLLRNGVGAVVVAGWAVDDMAAAAFARCLYERMLDGQPFGDAVFSARKAAHDADGGRTTTWGAYQCYGDPDFGFGLEAERGSRQQCLVSPTQLARLFDAEATSAGGARTAQQRLAVSASVDRLRDQGAALLRDGRVLEALGHAFSELGRFDEAVAAYEEALVDAKGRAHVRAAEQLANLRSRLAVRQARAGEPWSKVKKIFDAAAADLGHLNELCGRSAERDALQGSLCKKRATIKRRGRRQADLEAARDMYASAQHLEPKGYHLNNWLQLTALASPEGELPADAVALLDAHLLAATEKEASDPSSDYWEIAGIADTLLTYAVANISRTGQDSLQDAKSHYENAFRLRSTVRQRNSALEHLEDLCRLVAPSEAAAYEAAAEQLRKVADGA